MAAQVRDQGKTERMPTVPPNTGAMRYFECGSTLRPPHMPTIVKKAPSDAISVSPLVDLVAAHQLSENTPVFGDTPIGEAEATLPTTTESLPERTTERSTTPSDPAPSPPSPRLRQLHDDIPVWDPDGGPSSPGAPQMRDDMELDDDIPDWDPDEESRRHSRHQASEGSTSEERRAYQEHIKRFMDEGSLQETKRTQRKHRPDRILFQETIRSIPRSVPAESSAEGVSRNLNGYTRMFMNPEIRKCNERPRHPNASGKTVGLDGMIKDLDGPEAQKEKGSDQKLLEKLFRKTRSCRVHSDS